MHNTQRTFFKLLFLFCYLIIASFYSYFNQYRGYVYILETKLDKLIPFNKYFIIPYLYWYVFLFIIFVYFFFIDDKYYYDFVLSLTLGVIISFVIFYFFPTHVPRPNLTGDDFLTNLVKSIYRFDNPYNCFPSLHVFETFLGMVYINRADNTSVNFKLFNNITGFLIIVSTLFIKQHFILDVLCGIVLVLIVDYCIVLLNRKIDKVLSI